MNIHDYTGLHYDFRTHNCWQYVRRVRSDAGIDTPEFDCADPSGITDAFERGREVRKGMVHVSTPRNFDAVLMAAELRGRLVWHSGIYFDGMVSHCDRWAKQVRLQTLIEIQRDYQRVEFWR